MEYSNAFVCLLGIGIVFLGLICLIVLTKVMSLLCGTQTAALHTAPQPTVREPDRPELIAAVSAALAEDLGADITGIRILSIRKV